MPSKFNVLLLYKQSTYSSYFLSGKSRLKKIQGLFPRAEIDKFKQTHENHFLSLYTVEAVLKSKGVSYKKVCRGTKIDYSRYPLVIAVGGDGTFLEAARNIRESKILGVNSDPAWSVGIFCAANSQNFAQILNNILNGREKIKLYQRILLAFPKTKWPQVHVLNDILVSHINPAAISRYYLEIDKIKEQQRSSGLWVATAAGSSGAIHSAGGKLLNSLSEQIQYRPRELYLWKDKCKLKGGVLSLKNPLIVTSFMREGVIFVDGCHYQIPFPFGQSVKITQSKYPLKAIIA